MPRRKYTHRIWKRVTEIGAGGAGGATASTGTTSANVGAYTVPIGDLPPWQKQKKKKRKRKVQAVHQPRVPGNKGARHLRSF